MCTEAECTICEVGYGFEYNNERRFHRNDYIQCEQIGVFLKAHNRFNTFRSAYNYSSNNIEEADLFGDFYLDLDDENNFENVREDAKAVYSYFKIVYKITPDHMRTYFSGKKGLHIIVPASILGVEPNRNLNGIFKMIANSVKVYTPHKTVDMNIYDKKRLFRIPNTIHGDTGLFKIQITPAELMNFSINDIKRLATAPRELNLTMPSDACNLAKQAYQKACQEYVQYAKENAKDKKFKMTLNFTPPCIQSILENGAQVGQRNITVACLTGFYKSFGKSMNETIDLISEWNSKNTVPIGMSELKRTVNSMFSSDKMFGCSTLKTITECKAEECKIGIRKMQQEMTSSGR